MSRRAWWLIVVTVATMLSGARGLAAQRVYARAIGTFAVEIGARRGEVYVTTRWSDVLDPVTLVAPDAIVDSPGVPAPYNYTARVIRISLPPDTARRVVRDARRELTVPHALRFPSEGVNRITVSAGDEGAGSLYAYRVPTGDSISPQYNLSTSACRDLRMSTYMARAQWLAILDALSRAASLAVAEGRAHPDVTRKPPPEVPRAWDDVPCPARPFRGNASIRREGTDDFLGSARAAAVDFVVDNTGAVVPASLALASGDSALFAAARRAIGGWRFTPALDANHRRVAQRARIAVADRAPTTRADSLRLYEVARAAGAQFVTVASVGHVSTDRIVVARDSTQLHLSMHGQFPDVVFLPTVGGRASDWDQVAAALWPTIPSVAYDLRGHRPSGRSATPDYSLDAHVSDLEAVIRGATAARPILVAHGLSAAIAAEYARRHPERVRALMFVTPPAPKTSGFNPRQRVDQFIDVLGNRYRQDVGGLVFATYAYASDDNALLNSRIIDNIRTTAPDALAASTASLFDYDLAAAAAAYLGHTYVVLPYATTRVPISQPLPMVEWQPRSGAPTPRVHETRSTEMGMWAPLIEPRMLSDWLRRVIAEVEARR